MSIDYEQLVAGVTNEKEAAQAISQLVTESLTAIQYAEEVADKWNCPFNFDLAYGMGGSYTPNHEDAWNESSRGEWVSSTSNC